MDHSYSKERDRLQKTDHCYFTVGKKTPQVVLRKAQQLKEQTHDTVKSAIGQDHSYVRAEHILHLGTTDADGVLDVVQTAQTCSAPDCQRLPNACEGNLPSAKDECKFLPSEERRMTAAEALLTLDPAGVRSSVMDDLRSWMGSIQLDHPYGGQHVSNLPVCRDNPSDCDHTYERLDNPHDDDVEWSSVSQHQFDHAYNNQADRRLSDSGNPECSQNDVPVDEGYTAGGDKTRREPANSSPATVAIDDGLKDNKLPSPFQHCDHAYDANVSDPANFDEWRCDHSYETRMNPVNCCNSSSGPDWWDHAYVECHGTSPDSGSWLHSNDYRTAGRVADFVEGALV